MYVSNAYQGNPEDYVLINEAVEVLIKEEEARAYKGCVREVQLTLGHVRDLQRHRGTHRRRKKTQNTQKNRLMPTSILIAPNEDKAYEV